MILHPRDYDRTDKTTGRPAIKIRPKITVSLSPRQQFWIQKNALGWPAWLIDSTWEELETAKREKLLKSLPKRK